jgi:hypothetical protein
VTDIPPSLRQHLFDRVADRQITAEDLYKLKLSRESEFPKIFLLKGQPAKGKAL